jgi:hypothetical protein
MTSNCIPRQTVTDDNAFLSDLVNNRNRIQSALHKLYRLLKEKSLLSSPRGQLLVGIGFCLWRAVFLAKSTRDWEAAGEKAEKFLRHVIETNAVSFETERSHLDWCFGFYLGGAQYRIWHMNDLLKRAGQGGLDSFAQKIRDEDAAKRTQHEGMGERI